MISENKQEKNHPQSYQNPNFSPSTWGREPGFPLGARTKSPPKSRIPAAERKITSAAVLLSSGSALEVSWHGPMESEAKAKGKSNP